MSCGPSRKAHAVEELSEVLVEWNCAYNYMGPHQGLDYLALMQFLSQWVEESEREELLSTM